MKKILVTGGNGFIAGHTIELLKDLGYKVYTNVRTSERPGYLDNCIVYNFDVRDKSAMYHLVSQVDGVINLAGLLGTRHVDMTREFYDTNVMGALNIFDPCTEFETPIVQIGVGNWFENNDYSNTKYAAERELMKYAKYKGLKGNVVRGLNAFGERQKVKNTGKIIPTFVTKAIKNERLQVFGGPENCGIMDMIYVKDLARILVEVLEMTASKNAKYGEVYEAGSGVAIKVWDIANKVVELVGSGEVEPVPMRSGESKSSLVIAKNPFTTNLTPFDTALEKTIKYYKDVYTKDGDWA